LGRQGSQILKGPIDLDPHPVWLFGIRFGVLSAHDEQGVSCVFSAETTVVRTW
jgi:hypothetical protein